MYVLSHASFGSNLALPSGLTRLVLKVLALPLIGVALVGLWLLHVNISNNIHIVKQDELYRSAQLSADDLQKTVRQYGIETVINLRGAHPEDKWYQKELAAADELGIRHYDIKLSASRMPDSTTINELYHILKLAPRPILIHCQGGADRSGLVSALYLRDFAKQPVEEASEQLSLYYGHFPWLISRSGAMDSAFDSPQILAVATRALMDYRMSPLAQAAAQ